MKRALDRLRLSILRYVLENFDDLLKLDLKLARVLGAPAPHTLSSYSYELEKEGKPWGKFWRPIIDRIFYWLSKEINHCKKAYEALTNGQSFQSPSGGGNKTK